MTSGGAAAREKGNKWERDVCKVFQTLWQCEFRRSPRSGGWDKRVAPGDIIAINPDAGFPLSVECKAQEGWSLDDMLFRPDKGTLPGFLRQAWGDALGAGLAPVLVAKRNFQPPLIFMPSEVRELLLARDFQAVARFEFPALREGRLELIDCFRVDALEGRAIASSSRRQKVSAAIRAWAKGKVSE